MTTDYSNSLEINLTPCDGTSSNDLIAALDGIDAYEEVNFVGERAIQVFTDYALNPLVEALKAIHKAVGSAPVEKLVIKKGENSITIEKADLNKLDDVEKFAIEILKQL